MNIEQYEQAMKTISQLARMAGEAAKEKATLDEKLPLHKSHKNLQNIQRLMRMEYFSVEDVIESHSKVEFCEECKQQV